MPISYSYEGPLSQKAYDTSVQAGYQQQREDTRRFQAQQQLAYNQMAMQQAMEQQRMQNQRWLQLADQAGSYRNLMAQGQINSGLQQASQGFQREQTQAGYGFQQQMAQQGQQFDLEKQSRQYELMTKYQQDVRDQELNSEGDRRRREIEQTLQILDQARSSNAINDEQAQSAKADVYAKALGIPWSSFYRKAGEDPGTTGNDPVLGPYAVDRDGNKHYQPDAMDAQQRWNNNTLYVDPQTGDPVPAGTPNAVRKIWSGRGWETYGDDEKKLQADISRGQLDLRLKLASENQKVLADINKTAAEYYKAGQKPPMDAEGKSPEGWQPMTPEEALRKAAAIYGGSIPQAQAGAAPGPAPAGSGTVLRPPTGPSLPPGLGEFFDPAASQPATPSAAPTAPGTQSAPQSPPPPAITPAPADADTENRKLWALEHPGSPPPTPMDFQDWVKAGNPERIRKDYVVSANPTQPPMRRADFEKLTPFEKFKFSLPVAGSNLPPQPSPQVSEMARRSLQTITSEADVAKLTPGTEFIWTDGKIYRKN